MRRVERQPRGGEEGVLPAGAQRSEAARAGDAEQASGGGAEDRRRQQAGRGRRHQLRELRGRGEQPQQIVMRGGPLRLDRRVGERLLLGERRLARLVPRQLDHHAVEHRAGLAGEHAEVGADCRHPGRRRAGTGPLPARRPPPAADGPRRGQAPAAADGRGDGGGIDIGLRRDHATQHQVDLAAGDLELRPQSGHDLPEARGFRHRAAPRPRPPPPWAPPRRRPGRRAGRPRSVS